MWSPSACDRGHFHNGTKLSSDLERKGLLFCEHEYSSASCPLLFICLTANLSSGQSDTLQQYQPGTPQASLATMTTHLLLIIPSPPVGPILSPICLVIFGGLQFI